MKANHVKIRILKCIIPKYYYFFCFFFDFDFINVWKNNENSNYNENVIQEEEIIENDFESNISLIYRT